ncbi:SAM-dependent methyltransferase [Streptomyces mangrovisoli]|uniref:SAM-dependent methyltransferase n=2 Tax=Streptomyces mangrovisoli TaxID=1428628 RepID=A0A1J4P234_9ACTN|nr:SAM-dependent methyltransferase [Streptomyces mangrovisoli]
MRTVDDVLRLLDGLFAPGADRWTRDAGASWWDGFYADRGRPVPFFADKPDENLVAYGERGLLDHRASHGERGPLDHPAAHGERGPPDNPLAHGARGPLRPGRALDLGCGPGRNALHLASLGFTVDAVDMSPSAIAWARERARATGAEVRFVCGDAFALADGGTLRGPYDLIYDSGCFHHLPPHRRISHLAFLERQLAPDGLFGLVCFAAGGGMGSEAPDADFYRRGTLDGGLAYTEESLRGIFAGLEVVESRRMRAEPAHSARFGESYLWTSLFRRVPCPPVSGTTPRRDVLRP